MPCLQSIASVGGPSDSAGPAAVTGEAEQPEPAGTFDTKDFNVTGFSK